MMIKVTLATTALKKDVIVSGDKTPSQVLDENNVATTGATISLNMTPLATGELDKTFEELGCTDDKTAMLSAVVKADSAM